MANAKQRKEAAKGEGYQQALGPLFEITTPPKAREPANKKRFGSDVPVVDFVAAEDDCLPAWMRMKSGGID